MSVCTFIAANCLMDEVRPSKEYPVEINVDEGTIYDGDADDSFSLCKFREVFDYCQWSFEKQYFWSQKNQQFWP